MPKQTPTSAEGELPECRVLKMRLQDGHERRAKIDDSGCGNALGPLGPCLSYVGWDTAGVE
jgi:hypothetical protein